MTWPLVAVALAFTSALGALHLPYPLSEDQAMFLVAARELADGALMYRDYWDMKQPGVFWWYLLSGQLFGFDAVGLRSMDLLWATGVTLLCWWAVRARGTLAACLAPMLSFASFYAIADEWQLSQLELLISGPLVVVLGCAAAARERAGSMSPFIRYAIAGAMCAVVAIFKFMLVLVPIAMLSVALWRDTADRYAARRRAAALSMPLSAGLLGAGLVVVPVALWMGLHGTLSEALWTTFSYPRQAVHEYQRMSVLRFVAAASWFLSGVWALLPWAAYAVWHGLRSRLKLELMCLAWLLAGSVAIAMQILSYWEYHFDQLFVPLGILAAVGFVRAVDNAGSVTGKRLLGAALCVTALVNFGVPLVEKARLVSSATPFSAASLERLHAQLDDRLPLLVASAEAVRGLLHDGDRIVVWGDPRLYLLTGHRPVVEVNGATFYLAAQLEQVAQVLRTRRPRLVYLGRRHPQLMRHADSLIPRTVEELYVKVYENRLGAWYRLRDDLDQRPNSSPSSAARCCAARTARTIASRTPSACIALSAA